METAKGSKDRDRDRSHRNSDCDSPRKNGIIANGSASIGIDSNGGPAANGIDHAVNASNPMGPSGLV